MADPSAGGPPPLSPPHFPPLLSSSPAKSSIAPPPSSHPIPLPVPTSTPPSSTPVTSSPSPLAKNPSQNSSSPLSLWKDLFKRNADLHKNYPPPTFTPGGVPIVRAPASVLLKSSEAWKDHIICHFFGSPPPLRKIYADLNAIWGKHGQIQVHYFTPKACLIFIPNAEYREWVLDVGFWSAGNVSFAVSLWSPSSTLSEQPLSSAPVWLSLLDVPPQLSSEEGLAIVASGVGIPLPQPKATGNPQLGFSPPKIHAIVRLGRGPLPSSVIVQDEEGTEVTVGVEYRNLPPLCSSCNSYGHKVHRCNLRSRSPTAVAPRPSIEKPSSSASRPPQCLGPSSVRLRCRARRPAVAVE